MAYGASRRSKGYDLDPRDVVEEAARAAGMSVEEWLETAADGVLDEPVSSRHRRKNRFGASATQDYESPLATLSRRLERRSGRNMRDEEPVSEDRVARIVSDAVSSFEESLHATEQRTAAALKALSQNTTGASRSSGTERSSGAERSSGLDHNTVGSMIGDIERRIERSIAERLHNSSQPAPVPQADYSSLTRQLESRIEKVLGSIETRAQSPQAISAATSAPVTERANRDLRSTATINAALAKVNNALRALDKSPQQNEILKTLRNLDQRLTGIEQSPQNNPELIGQMVGEMAALNQHVSAQRPGVDLSSITKQMNSLGDRIDSLTRNVSAQPSQSSQFSSQFERLTGEISDLRNSIKTKTTTPDAGIETLRRQMATMGERLDGLTQKIVALRMNGTEMPQPRALDGELDELKRLILTSQAPVQDERVLQAIQSLEHKIAMVERTPNELSARLDRIQSMVGERPVAALPPHVETMLLGLANRLKDFDGSSQDDAAFARLHEEVQLISRKIQQTPDAMANPAVADVRGLERSISAILQQFDGLKADMGDLAEHAARKATQEALSHIQQLPASSSADLTGIEQSIQSLFRQIDGFKTDVGQLAEVAAHKATQEAFSRMPVAAAAAAPDLSGIEHSIQGLFRQMDAWKADMGIVAEDAARRATSEAMRQAPLFTSPPGAPDTTELQRALGDMQISQKDAERRTTQTLEAVHDTLKRVVDRLVDMEKDIERKSLAPAVASVQMAPAHTAAAHVSAQQVSNQAAIEAGRKPLQIQSAPDFSPQPLQDVTPQQAASPLPLSPGGQAAATPLVAEASSAWNTANPVMEGAAATVAAMRAQRLGVSSPTVTTTPPSSKSALGAALSAARDAVSGIKLPTIKKQAPQPSPVEEMAVLASAPVSPVSAASDMPLEPGSGRPQKGSASLDNDPKAKFLAAARQAAQAAAGQAAQALEAEQQGKFSNKTVAGKGLKTRHALLLGLAALVVAIGATLQFTGMPKLIGGAPKPKETVGTIDHIRKQVQLSHAARQNANETSAEARRLPSRQILAELQEPPAPDPRYKEVRSVDVARAEINPSATASVTASAPKTLPNLPADPVTVGSIDSSVQSTFRTPVAPPKSSSPATSISNDPLFKFEGLKDAPALKAAARNGDLTAYFEIGNRFADGKGAPRDPKIAALWFERAAELGSAPARYRLGALYREGKGVDRNPKMALAHFQSAAELGNARAMHNTAVLLAEGVNGAPDYAAATEWFKKAAEFGIRDSQFNLAILYARGLGVTQDLVASYNWFAAAARQGDEDANKKRDEVAARLSPDQLRIAKDVANLWRAKSPEVSANEVPVPAGGWDIPAKTSSPIGAAAQKRG